MPDFQTIDELTGFAEAKGLRVERLGRAIRIVGRGVELWSESAKHVRRRDLAPRVGEYEDQDGE